MSKRSEDGKEGKLMDDYDEDGKFSSDGGGKSSESEFELIDLVSEYCWSDGFLSIFRSYFQKHAMAFSAYAEGKTDREHELEYYELYQEYLSLYEETLESFLSSQNVSIEAFYKQVAELEEELERVRKPQYELFLHCLTASMSYESFFRVMIKEAKKQLFASRRK